MTSRYVIGRGCPRSGLRSLGPGRGRCSIHTICRMCRPRPRGGIRTNGSDSERRTKGSIMAVLASDNPVTGTRVLDLLAGDRGLGGRVESRSEHIDAGSHRRAGRGGCPTGLVSAEPRRGRRDRSRCRAGPRCPCRGRPDRRHRAGCVGYGKDRRGAGHRHRDRRDRGAKTRSSSAPVGQAGWPASARSSATLPAVSRSRRSRRCCERAPAGDAFPIDQVMPGGHRGPHHLRD